MNWYTASIIMSVEFKDKNQDKYPIWENLHLICAESEEQAFSKAEIIGHQNEGDSDGTFKWEDRPATWKFKGIRKLYQCMDSEGKPNDGDEVSYLQYELENQESLENLINGNPVTLKLDQ